ncbi:ABC transporter ATP-binding protein [Methanobacterium petrolearium]|uniref:ABC transporter ATP-binding protein n=1 Tax=Methanobacterium petrolearium TaxID=710190 RepID=UPI001AE3450D|nr:ABC transporter ATP-binding protein [Methanobacterium petrolearium]MBP1946004.1 ATP-binding cassette subfamily B protein [Methanobacterium petrolearium]BDZ70870.1 ABC transporter ATP-binding protein [Methanobacterium petrolearium]
MYKELLTLAGEKKSQLKSILILMSIYGMIKTIPLVFLYFVILEFLEPSLDIVKILGLAGLIAISYVILNIIDYHLFLRSMELGLTISYDVRMRLGDKLTKLSLGFFTKTATGELNTTIGEYVSRVEYFVTYMAPYLLSSQISTIIVLVLFFILDWRLALAALSITPLIWLAFRYSDKVAGRVKKEREKSLFEVNSRIVEFIQGIPVIKIFNQDIVRFQRFQEAVEDFKDKNIQSTSATIIPSIILLVFSSLFIFVILPFGLYFYFTGTLSLEVLIFFIIATPAFSESLAHYLYGYLHVKHSIGHAIHHIFSVLNEKSLPEPQQMIEIDKFDIEFENVNFSYADEPLLENISFKIEDESVTALIGPSGAGKTTITNLIARFWDVDSGKIKMGGQDVRDIPVEKLLSFISIVFQDVILFDNTVKENIRIGKKDATDEEVMVAAKAARCHEFIGNLPEGYDTIIGEGGSKLSEGQKQRISIARAILKEAPILIMDEATVYLDPQNEKLIQEAINELIKEKTVIVIAHRLSTIKSVDKIVVLENGGIVEEGNHGKLMEEKGVYYNFWEAQTAARAWRL